VLGGQKSGMGASPMLSFVKIRVISGQKFVSLGGPLRVPVAPSPKIKKSSPTSLRKSQKPLRQPAKKVGVCATRDKE
jgi:hypothetical protein